MDRASVRLLATGAVVALIATACGSSSSGGGGGSNSAPVPGVTATSVTIGSTQPLTGIAAPGYSEIAPASAAYFKWVNAHGGINGRTIKFKYLDDAYDPTKTSTATKQLVEQDKIFAEFEGLGTPTHEAVVNFLNQQKVPDVFVASGCLCWNNPSQNPETFGWLPDYTREGKILGDYVKKNFAGKKIGIFAQGDDFGQNGIKGFEDEIPAKDIADVEQYDPTNTTITPLVQKLQKAGAQVVVSFTVPAFTALLKLTSLQLGFNPQLVVSSVGSDPVTLAGLISNFSKGKAPGEQLIQGVVTDSYLPSPADPSNSWIKLFEKIYNKYMPKKTYPAFDGNVEYGMASAYTFTEALAWSEPARGAIFSDSSHTLHAAIEGQGIALARVSLLGNDLNTGALVRPFEIEIRSAKCHYLVYPPRLAGTPKVTLFREWLFAELGKDRVLRELLDRPTPAHGRSASRARGARGPLPRRRGAGRDPD